MIKKLGCVVVLLLLTILTSGSLRADELDDAYVVIIDQEQIIQDQKLELVKYSEREKERMLLRVPFTNIGISKDHANGFITGCVLTLVLL